MAKLFFINACIFLWLLIGWFGCVVKLCKCDFDAPYKAEVFYAVGIFVPPSCGVIGYMDFGK